MTGVNNNCRPLLNPLFSVQVGVPYRLDVFLAERFQCQSVFLYQASNISFVQPWQQTKAVDYLATVPESLHVGALVQEFRIGDKFTTGPYNVKVRRKFPLLLVITFIFIYVLTTVYLSVSCNNNNDNRLYI
jgi:hypothetical protein